MCGFVYTNFIPKNLSVDDIAPRGPDSNGYIENELGYFFHYRLATRETNITQPAINNSGILLYNGTEYTTKEDDVGFILKNLSNDKDQNINFIKSLYGDFSICWVSDDYILIARDCFGTKPLFYGIEDSNIAVASSEYGIKSLGLNPISLNQNTLCVLNRKTLELETKIEIVNWNITQNLSTIENVYEAFESCVINRYDPSGTVVQLSSGYDSGAIASCLLRYKVNFTIASYVSTENRTVLQNRFKMHNGDKVIFSYAEFKKQESNRNQLPWNYFLKLDDVLADTTHMISNYAKKNNIKVVLTGNGSDELYCDYGYAGKKLRPFSLFGGAYPNDLQLIYPWHNNSRYPLTTDLPISDYINGIHGIDGRHPFLDRKLFQTWLNTSVKVKNNSYKHWISEYLRETHYPYAQEKIGLGNNPIIF